MRKSQRKFTEMVITRKALRGEVCDLPKVSSGV
ncbi:hypothetical protein C7M52_02510 [Mixta theicola]|nr:hypothetical protein C7M52_02510 [Mixta theicola]